MNLLKIRLLPFLLTLSIGLVFPNFFEKRVEPHKKIITITVEIFNPHSVTKPNPLVIWVHIDDKGKISLNNETQGYVYYPNSLKTRLSEVFEARRANEVFKEDSNNVVKDVIVSFADSVDFENVVKVIKSIEEAGSDSIQLDTNRFVEKNQKMFFPIFSCPRKNI